MQCIVIANDPDEKEILGFVLRKAGMSVASSSELGRVLESWGDHPADLLLFSSAGNSDSVHLAVQKIRDSTPVSLILIVEGLPEKAVCDLLDSGADLVLSKPVSAQLLASQAMAIARRSASVPSFVIPNFELDDIQLDTSTRTVTVVGQEPRMLTQLEFRLLYTLMTNRGHVVPTEVIVERVWGYAGEGDRELVRGLVSRLRAKIDTDVDSESFIETIPGVGYRFPAGDI